MGIFDFFKKKEIVKVETSKTRLGFILLESISVNWGLFRENMKKEWNIKIDKSEISDEKFVIIVDDVMVGCGLMEAPIPDNEAEKNARNNFLW